MRCKQCHKQISGVGKPGLSLAIPAGLAFGGCGWAFWLLTLGQYQMPGWSPLPGWMVGFAFLAVASALVWVGQSRRKCPACGSAKMLDAMEEEGELASERQAAQQEAADAVRVELGNRPQPVGAESAESQRARIEDELRPQIEQRLRPDIERQLRAQLEAQRPPNNETELRKKIESELRPELERKLRPIIEAELLPSLERTLRHVFANELRPQIERELRPQIDRELRPQIDRELRPQIEAELRAEIERQRVKLEKQSPPPVGKPVVAGPTTAGESKNKADVTPAPAPTAPQMAQAGETTVPPASSPTSAVPPLPGPTAKAATAITEKSTPPSVEDALPIASTKTAPRSPAPLTRPAATPGARLTSRLTPSPAVKYGTTPAPASIALKAGTTPAPVSVAAKAGTTPAPVSVAAKAGATPAPASRLLTSAGPVIAKETVPGATDDARAAAVHPTTTGKTPPPQPPTTKDTQPDVRPAGEEPPPAPSSSAGEGHDPHSVQAKKPDESKGEAQAISPGKVQANPDPHERAKRRARVIVADLTLYEKKTLLQASRATDSKKALGLIWHDAVRSYNEAVSPEIRASTNYLEEELGKCLEKLRQS